MTNPLQNALNWRLNSPNVITEAIDNEAIAINLENGMYYTFNVAGSFLWQEIGAHTNLDNLAAIFSEVTNLSILEATTDIEAFILQLSAEQLICQAPDCAPSEFGARETTQIALYERPSFTKFDDLNALLLADPIHDVSEIGWPHVKDADKSEQK